MLHLGCYVCHVNDRHHIGVVQEVIHYSDHKIYVVSWKDAGFGINGKQSYTECTKEDLMELFRCDNSCTEMKGESTMTTVYLEGSGGNIGCTEKLHMVMVDFILVVNNKRYRFDTTNGNLSILCINGVDETTGVKNGYKNLVISVPDSNFDDYDKSRESHIAAIESAKHGCKKCDMCCKTSAVYDPFCTASGEEFRDPVTFKAKIPDRGSKCPYKD